MITITTLKEVQCWCGVPMALPENLVRNAQNTGLPLTCPVGRHSFSWESENEKLRKQLAKERAARTAVEDQLTATAKELEKTRKRAANGVCPCCKRSFVQLARHMKAKHPDYGGVST